jgi:ABC-type branched-subunit amino acid transport system ATPase component
VAIDALYQALVEINAQGVAIVLVEQNVKRALGISDHAVVLSRGLISYSGDPAGLLGDDALDAAYFGTADDRPTPSASLSTSEGDPS